MSVLPLPDAKTFLDVIHGADDVKLQILLDGAEGEALQFMNRSAFSGGCDIAIEPPSEPHAMPASVKIGVLLLLQASYQATPDDAAKLRNAAEIKLMPYRCRMGV